MARPWNTLAIALLAGCGIAPTRSDVSALHSRDVLTGHEIDAAREATAYDAVRELRPEFFRLGYDGAAGPYSPASAVVYVDDVYQGTLEILLQIPAGSVAEVRYLTPAAARLRFARHPGGAVIAVRSR